MTASAADVFFAVFAILAGAIIGLDDVLDCSSARICSNHGEDGKKKREKDRRELGGNHVRSKTLFLASSKEEVTMKKQERDMFEMELIYPYLSRGSKSPSSPHEHMRMQET